jgi:membrane associated rhomboid family serine protease
MRGPSRSPNPFWMRPVTERLSPTITALIVSNTLAFALYAVVKPSRMFIEEHLALGLGVFQRFELWQLITSIFFHLEGITFLFGMIGLWFVGAAMERELGRTRFLVLYFLSGVLANLAIAGVSLMQGRAELFGGSNMAVLAMFVAFGRVYNRTPARLLGTLVLEARTLTFILVGFALFADLLRGSMPMVAGDLVAVASGYLISGGRGAGLTALWQRLRKGGKPRRRFQVVDGGQPKKREERRSYLN